MKTLTSTILGLALVVGTAGLGFAQAAPQTETKPPAKMAKTKHRKHTKKAKKNANPPASSTTTPPPTK